MNKTATQDKGQKKRGEGDGCNSTKGGDAIFFPHFWGLVAQNKMKPLLASCSIFSSLSWWMLGVVLLSALFPLGACKEKKASNDPNIISRKEYRRRIRWGKPRCVLFCRMRYKLCSKYLKKVNARLKKKVARLKKKKGAKPLTETSCRHECLLNFIKKPGLVSRAMQCAATAKNCSELRSCNTCLKKKCPRGKKGSPTSQASTKPSSLPVRIKPSSLPASRPQKKAPARKKGQKSPKR
jgi:hypothetical protein